MTGAAIPEADLAALQGFGLRPASEAARFVEARALLDEATCRATLEQIAPELGATNMRDTASLVIKRFAYLSLAPSLYGLSVQGRGLDVSLPNLRFEYVLKERIWQNGLPMHSMARLEAPDHDALRHEVLRRAFAQNLTPLVHQMHRLFRCPLPVLWENVAVRVFSIYESRILPACNEAQAARAQRDFDHLLAADSTALFGLPGNPIRPFHFKRSQPEGAARPIRVRRTCCYYYRATEPAKYCGNCPLKFRGKAVGAKAAEKVG